MTQTFVSHLECSMTGKRYAAGEVHGLSEAGKPLLVRYDLERLAHSFKRDDLAKSTEPGLWRYAPMLPVTEAKNRISLGEVMTPLIALERSAAGLGAEPGKAIVKDEGRLPTGSFKARGLCLAVSMAKEFDIEHLAIPTNGNAGSAMAAYALINDCGRIVGEGKQRVGWFDVSTLKEPYRIEGKKTMGLELAEHTFTIRRSVPPFAAFTRR